MKPRDLKTLRKHLGANLRQAREDVGVSQEKLALDADVDRSYLSRIERAIGNPSLSVLHSIAVTLGHDVSDLLAPPGRDRETPQK